MVAIQFDLNLFCGEFIPIVTVNEANSTRNVIMESVRWNTLRFAFHTYTDATSSVLCYAANKMQI